MRGFPLPLPGMPGEGPSQPLVPPSEEHSYSLFEIDRASNNNSGISSRDGFQGAETGWEEPEEELLVSLPPPSRSTFWIHLTNLKALFLRCFGKLFTSVFCCWCRSLQALDSSKLCPQQNFRCQTFKVGGAALLLVLLGARLWRIRGGRRMISGVLPGGAEVVPAHPGWHATRDRAANRPVLWRLLLFWRLWRWPRTSAATEEPFSRVLDLVGRSAVKEVQFGPGSRLLLELKDKRKVASSLVPGAEAAFFHAVSSRVPRFKAVNGGGLLPAVTSFVAPLVLMGVWFRLLRGLLLPLQQPTRDSGTEREAAGSPPPTRFDEVISRQKEELQEIVCLLNGQQGLYNSMGARLPRGVLLVGPAGTGKTLLARAVAGETQAAFLSAAASEFTDIFVGQGARRVRELFRDARERAPCVVFIDELDALGCRSGCLGGAQATNQEYIQTINQLLAEIDGVMGAAAGVVLIAATNRLEAIDPALLRSGRFDRLIHLTLPDEDERLEILQLHAALKKLSLNSAARRHLKQVAAAAEGLSGADLENLLNESVFKAVRKGKTQIDEEALNEALITLLQRIQQARPPNERLGFSSILGCPV